MESNGWTFKRIIAIVGIVVMLVGFGIMTFYYFGYFSKMSL